MAFFFSFVILYTVGRAPWTEDQPVARPLPTHRSTQTQNKRTHSSMPRVGFELTNLVFEREKTVHALERSVTVIGHKRAILVEKLVWSREICIFTSHTKLNNETGKVRTFLSWNLLTSVPYHDHYQNEGHEHLYQRCQTTPCWKGNERRSSGNT
jgi:hypothetical protein